jgi:diaminopimelate epimerase
MILNFRKMHGLGNDFIVVDCRSGTSLLSKEQIVFLADRHRGIGFDQMVHLLPPKDPKADVYLDMYNADGSTLGACGNATRCVTDIILREKGTQTCVLQTKAGLLECARDGDLIRVNMGLPGLDWKQIPLSKQADTLHLPLDGDPVGVSMGNPHCVFFCANAEDELVDKMGPKIEHDPLFPDRTNVEFISVLGPDRLRMRVWERGAGITQACGSGACAAGVAAILRGLTGPIVTVELDGGPLVIEWQGEGHPVFMTGPYTYVFEGSVEL